MGACRGTGGRGAAGAGPSAPEKAPDEMAVPYDEWGPMIDEEFTYTMSNGEVDEHGRLEDRIVYDMARDFQPTTRKGLLADIEAFRNDDGTYGDDDIAIFIAYEDGSSWSNQFSNTASKPFKKRGIIGLSLSTPDYEEVWGEDWTGGRWAHERKRVPMRTAEDPETGEPGRANSYAGYKAVSKYRVRTRITVEPNGRGGYRQKRETIRRSTKVPV